LAQNTYLLVETARSNNKVSKNMWFLLTDTYQAKDILHLQESLAWDRLMNRLWFDRGHSWSLKIPRALVPLKQSSWLPYPWPSLSGSSAPCKMRGPLEREKYALRALEFCNKTVGRHEEMHEKIRGKK
jgi:hypothetical protein